MTIGREPRLARFLALLEAAVASRCAGTDAEALAGKIFSLLRSPGPLQQQEPGRLPVCAFLVPAFATARTHSPDVSEVVEALAALEPHLLWAPRPSGGPFASRNWPDNHANATLVGRDGLERRDDVHIGVSLLAPRVRYPDHWHAPEEVYLVLSPGRFKNAATPWREPGVGGVFHNPPGITHAMASDDAPLLAIWQLWSEPS